MRAFLERLHVCPTTPSSESGPFYKVVWFSIQDDKARALGFNLFTSDVNEKQVLLAAVGLASMILK